ncbi:MAG: DUF4919 domain-containing protein, partial [Bacteroidales bacterium]|nr:DUF4919 domain-containing protein [Bacteroidales bacterium]
HLYYGYIFQANYSPNPGSVYQQNLLVYLKKAKLSESDLKQMIKYSNLILKELPFDLKTLHILAYCYNELGDLENNHLIDYKRIMIIEAIFSSGDGLSEKTAWHVISNAHEYDIINELGYRYGGQQTIGLCDYVLVAQNSDKIEGFYFRMSNFIGD